MKRFFISALAAMAVTLYSNAQQLAFPGAEGYGAYASGGRGCEVVHVTNLNAEGPGSLAEAVSQPGRFVVFDVGGIIDITGKSINIASNITIAGQTAPGEGITIYGGRVIATGSSNIIMRYIRMRGGKSVARGKCTLTLDNCRSLMMDHCSVSWGPWDNAHIKTADSITWQYCINAEGIEPQRFGAITDGTTNWTIHHCLWAGNKSRNPKMKCRLQYYNNVVYNCALGIIGGHSAGEHFQDVMNNYFIAGPDGTRKYYDNWTATDHLYSTGNYYDGNRDGKLNGTLITDYNQATPMDEPNFKTTHPMKVETAEEAYAAIAKYAGASLTRDVHDQRIIDQLTSLGTKGSFIANEDNVGGIGTLANGPKPIDSDNDGMPDVWEKANGLNPVVNDANGYELGGGYTNIEHYVNSLTQQGCGHCSLPVMTASDEEKEMGAYLFTFFNDPTHSLFMAISYDGYTFTAVNDGKPVIGGDSIAAQHGIRDPHICRAPNGYFYIAMTDLHVFGKQRGLRDTQWERDDKYGWGNNRGLVLMRSKDLIHWTHNEVFINEDFAERFGELGCAWAPQTIWDPAVGKPMIYFTIRQAPGERTKLYYAYADEAFTKLETEPLLLFEYPDEKIQVLDADICPMPDGRFFMTYVAQENPGGIKYMISDRINHYDDYHAEQIDTECKGCEAPNTWKRIGEDKWVVMYDIYSVNPHNFGFVETTDFKTFTPLGRFNEGVMKATNFASPKHGSVIHITKKEARRLEKYWKKQNRTNK